MHVQLFLNGSYRDAHNGAKTDLIDPATGQAWATTALAGAPDVDEAVAGAQAAFQSGVWAGKSPFERSAVIYKAAELLRARAEEFAQLESQNTGKPIREARQLDVPVAIQHLEWYAGVTSSHLSETIPLPNPAQLDYSIRQPLGVIGAITPWNFPLFLAILKIGPALAMGNSVVVKPSEFTPLTTSLLGRIFKEAGLPDGVLQIVPGLGHETGEALANDPRIAKIFFTGGTATGKHIKEVAARNSTLVALELGGKSPNIIFADANRAQALAGALFGALLNCGQNCIAGTRLLVEESIYSEFTTELARLFANLRVGPPSDLLTQIGPLSNARQYERVLSFLDAGAQECARALTGGPDFDRSQFGGGFYVPPTLFVDANNDMKIAREEIFGPILTAIPFRDEADAIAIANQTEYGLGAGVFTSNASRAHRMARAIEAGTVYVNTYCMVYPQTPIPAWKASGNGVDRGWQGILEYTRFKNIVLETSDTPINWFDQPA